MKKMFCWFVVFVVLLLFFVVVVQQKGLDIDIIGGNVFVLLIIIVLMFYQGLLVVLQIDVVGVVCVDLECLGQFCMLLEVQIVEKFVWGGDIQFVIWCVLKQNYIVVGCVFDVGVGVYCVEYELFDVFKGECLLGLVMIVCGNVMCDVVYQMVDVIYEKIIGVCGVFWICIVYVIVSGKGDVMCYVLMVVDFDGFNLQIIVCLVELLLLLLWSLDGSKLVYVSFECGNLVIYIQNIGIGVCELVISFRGINSVLVFLLDGCKLVLILLCFGNLEIYVMDLGSKQLIQLINYFVIDIELIWVLDGSVVYFIFDCGGCLQVYKVGVGGGSVECVIFQGNYNVKLLVFYDGKKIVVVQGLGNSYKIVMMDSLLGLLCWSMLFLGLLDELLSFVFNVSMVLYVVCEGGCGVLYVVLVDVWVCQCLVLVDGDVCELVWFLYCIQC